MVLHYLYSGFSHYYQVLRNEMFKKDLKTQFFLSDFFLKLHDVTSLLNNFFQFTVRPPPFSTFFRIFLSKDTKGAKLSSWKISLLLLNMRLASGFFKYAIRISGMNFLSQFDCHTAVSSAKVVSDYVLCKGQIIWKGLFGILNSPK